MGIRNMVCPLVLDGGEVGCRPSCFPSAVPHNLSEGGGTAAPTTVVPLHRAYRHTCKSEIEIWDGQGGVCICMGMECSESQFPWPRCRFRKLLVYCMLSPNHVSKKYKNE